MWVLAQYFVVATLLYEHGWRFRVLLLTVVCLPNAVHEPRSEVGVLSPLRRRPSVQGEEDGQLVLLAAVGHL